jgi:hypothetical protein
MTATTTLIRSPPWWPAGVHSVVRRLYVEETLEGQPA